MRVLLVEDEKKVSSFIKKGLEEHGYAVDYGSDGKIGLLMALDQIHDLVILDINLPEIDGLTVLRRLRSSPATSSIPVVLLTAKALAEDRVRGLDLGADDYITKPFSNADLVAKVKTVLDNIHEEAG